LSPETIDIKGFNLLLVSLRHFRGRNRPVRPPRPRRSGRVHFRAVVSASRAELPAIVILKNSQSISYILIFRNI
jgi:hypothetical protein